MSSFPSLAAAVKTDRGTTLPNGKQEVTILFDERPPAGMPVLVHIASKREGQVSYWAQPIDGAQYGDAAVEFRKLGQYDDDGRHAVMVEHGRAVCDCRGFERHDHCRHAIAALLLIAAGLMRPAPRPEQAEERPAKAERPRFCRFCGCSADLHGECNGDPFAFCPI
jgi:hypothetical protein